MKIPEKHNQKLLVEGNEDQHVIWALCEKYKLPENFDVVDCEGIDKLMVQIPVRFKQSGIETIGIIIDADTDINSRWQTLKDLFDKQEIVLPEIIPIEGLILNKENIKIGIWIMPNNNQDGMLEDFINFLIPIDDKLSPIITKHLTEIETKGINSYKSIHKSKAFIHSWLAVQETPGTPMGLSITKRYLTTDETTCLMLINWLRNLFV